MAGDLIERLRAHAGSPVNHWEDWANRSDTLLREAATDLATEREAREKAEKDLSELHDALLAGEAFGFDPSTNFIQADDGGARSHCVFYVPRDRAEAAESSIAEARRLGGMLANAAYNIVQRGEVDATTLRSLDEARRAWDAALTGKAA